MALMESSFHSGAVGSGTGSLDYGWHAWYQEGSGVRQLRRVEAVGGVLHPHLDLRWHRPCDCTVWRSGTMRLDHTGRKKK